MEGREVTVISYKPFWDTLNEKGITQYSLINDYQLNRRLIHKLKHDLPVNTTTLDDISQKLGLPVEKIIVLLPDNNNNN